MSQMRAHASSHARLAAGVPPLGLSQHKEHVRGRECNLHSCERSRIRNLEHQFDGIASLQVLDDSTCKVTRQLVDEKAAEWAERGIRCDVVRRTNRQGYKAGALKDVSLAAAPCPSQ